MASHDWAATPWLFLAPALLVIVCFIVGPFFSTLQLAFTDALLLRPGTFVGLANFERMFSDARFGTALFNSTLYMVVVVPFMVFLPLVLAALVAGAGKFLGFFRTAAYLPVIMSPVIVGLIWTNLLSRQGLVNEVFATLGTITEPIPFLTDRWLLIFSAMFVTIWMGMGYYMVIYLAALANIDPTLYDAAAMDGAGRIRTFFSVTIPGVRNTMGLIGILSSVAAFRVFGEVYVLTGGTGGVGGTALTMTMLIQREGTGLQAQTGYAAAISLVMFVVLGALLVLQLVIQQRQART
ncbi:carbohydrate ABC transporter permease [Microbacterium sp. VKM Ac-2923]|uniref:carbohydrate ABC transporter permease n=1 Tax=Microbacterium sp. VKM Ac-2923 TaxID=2929476 RepID=UPI001FB23AA0|nr:sugar ABC transporter permease [Microbacterium sp. VKM Ac-2923]MCJ1708762.1 sugar ABC transporter permease [Microbacterium sp. VKM Ac-2923]